MRLATIAPTHLLEILDYTRSSYHMALGQWLVTDRNYRRWFKDAIERGDFVMVDNGAAEPEAERVSFVEIADVCLEIGANEVVMPDVLKDSRATIEMTTNPAVLKLIPVAMRVVIPQGDSWEEWFDCLNELENRIEFRTIGVPKHLERLPGGRKVALDWLNNNGYDCRYDIHMFGVWEFPFKEINAAHRSKCRVRGIDTGAPIAYAQAQERITDEVHCRLENTKQAMTSLAVLNLRELRAVAHGG